MKINFEIYTARVRENFSLPIGENAKLSRQKWINRWLESIPVVAAWSRGKCRFMRRGSDWNKVGKK